MRSCSYLLAVILCWLCFAPPAAAQPTAIDVVYSGNEGGVTGLSVIVEETNLLAAPPEWELADFSLDMPAYRQGRYVLIDPDGHLSTERIRRFFQQAPVKVEPGTRVTIADSNYSLQLQWPLAKQSWAVEALLRLNGKPPKYPDLFEKSATVSAVTNAAGDRLWLLRNDGVPRYRLADLGLPGLPPAAVVSDAVAVTSSDTAAQAASVSDVAATPKPSPFGAPDFSSADRWEPVMAARAIVRHAGRETRWLMISRQLGTWDRRAAMIRRALAHRPGALLVGTGNTIDTPRAITNDEARKLSIKAVKTLPYTAFVPSAAEFALSLDEFRAFSHDVPLIAANVTSPDPEVELPPYRIATVDGHAVGIVGIVDREALRDAGVARMDAGWSVSDPIKAAKATIIQLRAQGIETIVIVTDLAFKELRELEAGLEGVSLVVGGGSQYPSDLSLQQELDFDNAALARHPMTPMIVAPRPFRIGAVRLTMDADARHGFPVSFRHQTWRIGDEEPGDPSFAWQVAGLRESVQAARQYALLPDVRLLAGAQAASTGAIYYSSRQWSRLAAGIVRDKLKAEVVILPLLRQFWNVAGAIPAYMVDGWLAGQDRLVPLTLTGAQLQRLKALDTEPGSVVMAGYDPAVGKVDGTALNGAEHYRVIVSDRVVSNPRFAEVFGKGEHRPATLGELRPLVLDKLETLRRTVPGYPETMAESLRTWLNDDGLRIEPRFTVAFEELGVNALSFQNLNQSPYSKVRNTRINTPENSTLGTQGRISVNYASELINWTGRIRAAYQQLNVSDKTQENADDLVVTSDVRFNFWKVHLANTAIQITPYLFGSYDTEFTPVIDTATQQPNPQQRDFDGIAGLVSSPGAGFQDVKLGTIVRYDATAGVFRPGLQVASTFDRQLTTASPVRIRLMADLRHYFTVAAPTPDQLGFLGDLSAALIVPLWQNLNLTLGTNALLYRGQADGDPWGLSFNPTIGISYGGVWKPQWGLAF